MLFSKFDRDKSGNNHKQNLIQDRNPRITRDVIHV